MSKAYRILTVFGTRPEAIKLAPLVKLLESSEGLEARICVTAQHRQMLDQVLALFDIRPDYDLDLMRPGQSLSGLSSAVLDGLASVLDDFQPDLLVVQGDTTTTFMAALAAYYRQIPIAHVEAGLRTGDLYAPWPEEGNRKMVAVLASRHFVATSQAGDNLLAEGISKEGIHLTGNTVIDALKLVVRRLDDDPELSCRMQEKFSFLREEARLILITAHRRENFGEGFVEIAAAIAQLADIFPEVDFVFPVHPNPNVREPMTGALSNYQNVHLLPPLDYPEFVFLMSRAYFVLTDSGGIQEEAPALGKPVLLMRESTERAEAVAAGAVRLVGTDMGKIVASTSELLNDIGVYRKMAVVRDIFGDGNASQRILKILKNEMLNIQIPEAIHD